MNLFSADEKRVLGLTTEHLLSIEDSGREFLLEGQTLAAFTQLKEAAQKAGFDLSLVSAFRSYDRQKQIFEGKLRGKRKVHDDEGNTLDLSHWPLDKKINAIIRFSAVPGLSPHHFGSDIDVFDANVASIDDVLLEPQEVAAGGVFAPLHDWLDDRIDTGEAFGFYRPFVEGNNTVAPERWHLSYQPVSNQLKGMRSAELLVRLWQSDELAAKAYLVEHVDDLLAFFCG